MIAALEPTAERLAAFADLLESHVRLEERQVFPLYQEHASQAQRSEVEARVREILQRADDTAKGLHPAARLTRRRFGSAPGSSL